MTLRAGNQNVEVFAKLDTGSVFCIFERRYAKPLGLDVEAGRLQRFRTAAGFFAAYAHEVTIEALGLETTSTVFFAEDQDFRRNFLGRTGWLDRVRLGIVDYEQRLYLSPYDE